MIHERGRFVLLIFIISGVYSCRTTGSQAPKEESNILFVNLKIYKDPKGHEVIEMVSKMRVKGELKKTNENEAMPSGKLLICEFMDSRKKVLSSVTIQNPLATSVEQYSLEGTIERKEPKLTMASFTLRSEVSAKAVNLQILDETGKKISLLSLQ